MSITLDQISDAVAQKRAKRPARQAIRAVSWKDKSGKIVATSRRTTPAIAKKAAEPSPESFRLITDALLAEAFATEDEAVRSRLLDAAGRADIRRRALERTEEPSPLSESEVDRLVQRATGGYGQR